MYPGTLIGQAIGWRVTFFIVAALGLVGLLGIAKLVPDLPKPEGVSLRHELAAFKNAQVLLGMAMTVLGFGGVFAAITYVASMMTEAAGFAESSVTWLLVLFGLGMVVGNLVGGKFAWSRPFHAGQAFRWQIDRSHGTRSRRHEEGSTHDRRS